MKVAKDHFATSHAKDVVQIQLKVSKNSKKMAPVIVDVNPHGWRGFDKVLTLKFAMLRSSRLLKHHGIQRQPPGLSSCARV